MKVLRSPARIPATIALTLMLGALWLLTHRYQGLSQDARIYAVQALSKIHPALTGDLYLQNVSQDRFTLFSPFYAAVISLIGLQDAARVLTLLFATGFLVAAWNLAKNLLGPDAAWLSVGTLILTVGAYGSYGVFHFSEDYLSARSAAEALVAVALAIHSCGLGGLALLVAAGALLVHPLMALPGVLLLVFWRVPTKIGAFLAIIGIALLLAVALSASALPSVRLIFPIMDPAWLHIVRERSQFLFLQLWSVRDWELNLRPFVCLALSAAVLADPKIRKLCLAAAMVGASGLIVALVAGMLGPVALLVQGQAWRWVWIAAFASAILLLPTALRLWRDDPCGPLCALLLVASWTMPTADAPAFAVAALALFLVRAQIAPAPGKYLRWAAVILVAALFCWEMANVVTAVSSVANAASLGVYATSSGAGAVSPAVHAHVASHTTTAFLQRTATIAALRFPLCVLLLLTWQLITSSNGTPNQTSSQQLSAAALDNLSRRSLTTPMDRGYGRSLWMLSGVSIALGIACILLVPIAFARIDAAGSASEIAEFADWRGAIPPSATVYVANGHDAAPFAWFTLQRANYLSLDQSAGVVFSRATALEVQRRSRVLLPIMDEDWKLLSRNLAAHHATASASAASGAAAAPGATAAPRRTPLTAKSLLSLCRDPQLGFMIAHEDVGFDPVRHRHPGLWNDWNLYDCGHVRSLGPAI